jgi:hypothetical protein
MIITRVTINTNGWKYPSGKLGKSNYNNTHECEFGFGFEEWLFNDRNKMKNEFGQFSNYGYLEGINKNYKKGVEKSIIKLFTIDKVSKERYWVGEIKNWKLVEPEESLFIIKNNPDVIASMRKELTNCVDLKVPVDKAIKKFEKHLLQMPQDNNKPYQLFNIKFTAFNLFNPIIKISPNDIVKKYNRFWLHRQ